MKSTAAPSALLQKLFYFLVLPLVLVCGADVALKSWAQTNIAVNHWSPPGLDFYFVQNHGAVLGLFSNLGPLILIVLMATLASLLVCVIATVLYFLPAQLRALPLGLSLFLAGVVGNAWDRIAHGYVTDFVALRFGSFTSPYINLADLSQWVGYGLLVYAVTFGSKHLWQENDSRSYWLVNRKFQWGYVRKLVAVNLLVHFLLGTFGYTFLKYTIIRFTSSPAELQSQVLYPFVVCVVFLCLFTSILVGVLGMVLSHQVAGPVYAFQRFVRGWIIDGSMKPLVLRQGDAFKEDLESLAASIAEKAKR